MSKSEIRSWISSASLEENGESSTMEASWQRDRVLEDWSRSMDHAQRQLLNSSTKLRTQFVQEELLYVVKHQNLTLSQIMDIFKLLMLTHLRYPDEKYRNVVEAVGVEMIMRDELRGTPNGPQDETKIGVTEQVLGWLSIEVGQLSKRGSPDSYAPSDILALLSWTYEIYAICVKHNPDFSSTNSWRVLINTLALILDMMAESSQAKPSLKKRGLTRTRRALQTAGDKVPLVIETTLAIMQTSQTPLRIMTLAGMAVSVLVHQPENVDTDPVARLSVEAKNDFIASYTSIVLMARINIPEHILDALDDFISTFVTPEDFNSSILPVMEKALLRSPEYCLNAMTHFFLAYKHKLEANSFQKMLTQIINSAKSTNSSVRSNLIPLLKAVLSSVDPANPHNLSRLAVNEIISMPKANKTAGPDHRIALYSMLKLLLPGPEVSSSLVQTGVPLLVKETHDLAVLTLAAALPPHIHYLLEQSSLPLETTQLIAKEMNNSKPAVRRAFCSLTGTLLFEDKDNLSSPNMLAFAKGVLPSLENSLKNVASNPLNVTGGPLEGYIAVATLLGCYYRSGQFNDVIAKNPSITAISSSSAKQSFLIWEKVYQKLTSVEDETWLLRACVATLNYFKTELLKNEIFRSQLGLVFVHLVLESQSLQLRKSVYNELEISAAHSPKLTNLVIRDALTTFLAKWNPAPKPSSLTSTDEQPGPWNKHSRLSALLMSVVSFGDGVDAELRESLIPDLLIIGHHQLITGPPRQIRVYERQLQIDLCQTWIDFCQKAGVNPHELVNKHFDKLQNAILEASTVASKFGFAQASYSALGILAFVSPDTVVPRMMEQIRTDLNPEILKSLSAMDLGVWATPEGTTYVDILSQGKNETRTVKGKDAEISKWEEDIRKSLASKKAAGNVTLTKQQQALVQTQLEKEAKIRQRVAGIKQNMERSLHFIRSLAAARVPEFSSYLSQVVSLLLDGVLIHGTSLVGQLAYETYQDLAICCSDRLASLFNWISIATLRCLKIDLVPADLLIEPLNSLVIRILYRIRTLSEQAPLDAPSFSYFSPLIEQVLIQGGINAADEDEKLEQITLALNIIKFNCGEFSDPAFPRLLTMTNLLHVIRQQPKLGQEASSTLVELGQATHASATRDEIDVLIKGTLSQESYARNSCLQTIQPFDLTDLDWSPELWISCHDEDEQNARLAQHVWDDNGLDVPENFLSELLDFLGHENNYVRLSTAAAIAEAVEQMPSAVSKSLETLQDYYREKAKILAPEFDEFGMVIPQSLDRSDPWPARSAVALAFELMASSFLDSDLEPFFLFLIQDQALGDRDAGVRRGMLSAGTKVIDLRGASRLAALISIFEKHLEKSTSAAETDDYIKEAVVILFGRVARHLEASDPRIPGIVDRLVEALKTPAEQVQIAVSECLSPLVKLMRPTLSTLVDNLLNDLFNAPKYGVRRGAAYGLAGVLSGTGIGGMKEFNIMARIRAAAEDKKHYEARQGVMFVFETLSTTLGRLFEPYITYALPLLLTSFGDSIADVREATEDAARVIMGNLSGYGVKLILPTLLEGLDEKQWRSKKGSIELLGMMAYCSPRQLSVSLPIVIPRLTGVLTDSHAQVRTAANRSLKQFGEVISNPEIQSLVPVLLKALVDPAKTPNALTSVLKTSFMHYIDHSSLALLVPILERGLRERGAETKKKAARIVGNLASLTDTKDFVPYLNELLPLVHQVLVDPVPEARATAAKALGTLVERMGENHFPDLVPGLLRTLKTDSSGVDRQGAAQGLSEVISGLGMERLEGLLPDIIANARSPRATVREGFMSLLVYLPATFGTRFQPHLPKIISPILSGLSDTEEYVREAAMRAGRMVVTNYSHKAIDLLLPELERGMFDPGWRIRQSSITLVGELLFKVSGISGKASDFDEEMAVDASTAENSRRALVEILGSERRDRILSALYLVRQDGVMVVRQASIQIWKALVSNTPRTVREILQELLNQVVALISSDEPEQEETASRTVGELCKKFGERILGDMIPILKTKSSTLDARTRQGVCLVVSVILESSTEAQREDHEDEMIFIVRSCLVDDEANVRSAAAQAFDTMQEVLGAKAIDQTIPTLLEALRQPGKGSGTALQALREVMAVRASTVFPVLIPTLTALPMTVFNAHALASLVTVAGNALSKRLTVIMNALVTVSEDNVSEELLAAVDEAMRALLSSIADAEGLNTLMMLLIGWAKSERPRRRVSGCNLFAVFCEVSDLDTSLYRIDWIRQLISLLGDSEVSVHTAAWNSFDVFVKSVPKDELEPLVVPLRRSIEGTGVPGQHVPGFSLPKGVSPAMPIIIAGLTTGSNEQREQAAYAIGDLVERTEENAIKPYVVSFTGPLIRVATQATTYPPAVKTAIISALTSMLEQIPGFVKPFFPQLQRTFVKSASDPASKTVRNKAAFALGVLMKNQPRVDPVIVELITGARTNEDTISTSLILALSHVVKNAGQNLSDKAKEACVEFISDAFREPHDEHYCEAIGALVKSMTSDAELLRHVVQSHLVIGTPPSTISSHVILGAVSEDEFGNREEPNIFQKLNLLRKVAQKALDSATNEKPNIARPAREARDLIKELDDDSLLGLF